ncbi:phage tail protein [Chromobacterium piscinae]|uniref:phage tail protein n=1 Tax=Chromobacterium piscinae TaxID=686831 RepID=UPI00360F0851
MEAYIGSIIPFAFDYPPVDWAQCQGQTLQVSQNQALFAVIGNHYGGNGSTNFQLPNLCGRMPISIGPAQPTYNLPSYAIGNFGGQQTVALLTSNMPLHAHGTSAVSVSFQASTVANPNPPRQLAQHQQSLPGRIRRRHRPRHHLERAAGESGHRQGPGLERQHRRGRRHHPGQRAQSLSGAELLHRSPGLVPDSTINTNPPAERIASAGPAMQGGMPCWTR